MYTCPALDMIVVCLLFLLLLLMTASSQVCHNQRNIPCPGGVQAGCLPASSVCDGSPTCRDGQDEEEIFCGSWTCSPGLVKCPDNLQCIPELNVCSKARWRYPRHQGKQCIRGGTHSPEMCSK